MLTRSAFTAVLVLAPLSQMATFCVAKQTNTPWLTMARTPTDGFLDRRPGSHVAKPPQKSVSAATGAGRKDAVLLSRRGGDWDRGVSKNAPAGRNLNRLNVIAYILNLAIIQVVGQTPFLGKTNAGVTLDYPSLFTPAFWAFSIWPVIYALEGVWSGYQLANKDVAASDAVQKGIGPYWIIMSAAQIAWAFAFAYEQIPLSQLFMTLIWFCLWRINAGLKRYLPNPTIEERLRIVLPFSLNFGWITAALLTNLNLLAVYLKLGWAEQIAIAVVSIAALAVASFASPLFMQDPAFPAALAWGGAAVAKELDSPRAAIIKTLPPFVTRGLSLATAVVSGFAALITLSQLFSDGERRQKAARFAVSRP